MSWDIVLIKSKQKISSIEELDENQLETTDFCSILEMSFERIVKDGNHREIIGLNFTIDYFIDEENVSNKILNLYGEKALWELILLAQKYNCQIYDTGIGKMIDLENPQENGFENFQKYLKQIINDKDK